MTKTDLSAAAARKDAEAAKLAERTAQLDAKLADVSTWTREAAEGNEVRQAVERNAAVTVQRDRYRAERDASREAHRAALAMMVAKDTEIAAAHAEVARLHATYEPEKWLEETSGELVG